MYREPPQEQEPRYEEQLPPHAERVNGGIIYRDPSVAVCCPPGWWSRLFNGIALHHVWECPICKTLYRLRETYDAGWKTCWIELEDEEAEKFRSKHAVLPRY